MVDCHGSQCGFCTPGFVMSMWALYAKHGHGLAGSACTATVPSRDEIANALTGNLCRCTGYRPIVDAAVQMFAEPAPKVPLDVQALARTLAALGRDGTFCYEHDGRRYDAPRTVDVLAAIKAERPATRIVAGNTDVGLWVTKQMRDLGDVVYVGGIGEMNRIEESGAWIEIGAAVTLERAYEALAKSYPELTEMWLRFASLPIRNAGTLGGNVANGSPIGDSMPALIALGARVVLRGGDAVRELPLEDLYVGYQKKAMADHEFVLALKVPARAPQLRFRTYKVSKRFDSDISAVCAAFAFIADGDAIRAPRIAFGGMAATPKRAARTEAALADQAWHEATAQAAMLALGDDYAPLTDMRASSDYRLEAAKNTLYRFWLETRPRDPLPKAALDVRAVAAENGTA
jgi:xanthine dehydrogenase small subunit